MESQSTYPTDQIENPDFLCSLLSISQKDDNNYKERIKLINSITYNSDSKKKINIYFHGIIPAKTLPCAYIPFNYNIQKLEYNNKKLNKNNSIKDDKYLKIWKGPCSDSKANIEKKFKELLKNALTELNDNESKFNINTRGFLRNLLIIWGFIILFIKIILYYYYPSYYNYFLIAIIFILLVTAIILKMINTIRN
tara:strand:+ start:50 stop:634 length:585 start_codon:yes stop_codon:yes gene_type:complete